MANFYDSANMTLPIPVVSVDPGPDWANNINASLTLIDSHDHSPGKGVLIGVNGLSINADLAINDNNLITIRSSRYTAQPSPLTNAADVGCVYVAGVDLYYNDVSGNRVRITSGGAIAGTPGSISGLVSPASASYVVGSAAFVWQSDVNTPANMDAASYIFRNLTANSHGLTLNPPSAMGSNYVLTLPPLPGSQKIMTLDVSGNITAPYTVDNTTIAISSNVIGVKAAGITPPLQSLPWTVINSSTPVVSGTYYLVDATSGAIALTLPSGVSGAFFYVKDVFGKCATNNITIVQHTSENIENVAATKILRTPYGTWGFSCSGTDWEML